MLFLLALALDLQNPQAVQLTRFEVLRLPKYARAAEFGVTDSTSVDVTIAVADLTDASRTAKATDVPVPQNWEATEAQVIALADPTE